EHLLRTGECADPRGDVDGQTDDIAPDQVALARVQAGANLDRERLKCLLDRACAPDSHPWALEGGQESVPQRLDLTPPVVRELRPYKLVVTGQQFAPARVAERGGALRGADDVGEHDRRQHA